MKSALLAVAAGILWHSAASAWAVQLSAGALIQVSTSNVFAACTADTGQHGQNYADSEVEPWIAVNPINASNIVGVWQQDRWSNGGSRGLVAGVSLDAGTTWQSVPIPGLSLCSGGDLQRATDPWISFAPDGTLYQIALSVNEDTVTGSFGANALLVSKSTNGGFTWNEPTTLTETTEPSIFNDKESITADPADPDFVYAVWDRLQPFRITLTDMTGPTVFSRTTDAGQTWEPPRVIYEPGKSRQTIGNQIVVLPDGTIVNVSTFIASLKKGAARNSFATQRSFDHGATWERRAKRNIKLMPRSAFAPDRVDIFDPETGQPLRTGEIITAAAVDPTTGTLCVVWQDARFSGLAIDEIAFAQSTDRGRHWSKPIKINLTPTGIATSNRQAFTPSIRVAADGTIAVTYYDLRFNDSGPDLKTDYWAIFCKPTTTAPATNPANWSNELRLTDASFDFRQAPNAGGFFVGDYVGLAATGNEFLAFWSQPHAGDPASIFFRRLGP